MTSTWELSEFDQHLISLDKILQDIGSAKTTSGEIGGGNLYIYGLLVGPVATPVMGNVVGDFDDVLAGLTSAVEATQEGISTTRRLNHETEQQNKDNSDAVAREIEQTQSEVQGGLA